MNADVHIRMASGLIEPCCSSAGNKLQGLGPRLKTCFRLKSSRLCLQVDITPQQARLRDITYSAEISVDIEYSRGRVRCSFSTAEPCKIRPICGLAELQQTLGTNAALLHGLRRNLPRHFIVSLAHPLICTHTSSSFAAHTIWC